MVIVRRIRRFRVGRVGLGGPGCSRKRAEIVVECVVLLDDDDDVLDRTRGRARRSSLAGVGRLLRGAMTAFGCGRCLSHRVLFWHGSVTRLAIVTLALNAFPATRVATLSAGSVDRERQVEPLGSNTRESTKPSVSP